MTINKSFLQFIAEFKSIDEKKQIVRGVIGSDDSIDRHGDRINPAGWDLVNYKKSPTILLNHDYHALAIGKAIDVRIENNQLVFDIEFSKTYDVAVQAFNLVKEGIMKAFSVGFLVKEWGNAGDQYTINAAELLELSLVTVPANPNALTQEQNSMVELFTKALEVAEQPEEKHEEPAIKLEDLQKEISQIKEMVIEATGKMEQTISEKITQQIDELTKLTINQTEEDEVVEDTPLVSALKAVKAELKDTNKDSGKALKLLNSILNTDIKE